MPHSLNVQATCLCVPGASSLPSSCISNRSAATVSGTAVQQLTGTPMCTGSPASRYKYLQEAVAARRLVNATPPFSRKARAEQQRKHGTGRGVSLACRKTISRQLRDIRNARRSAFVSGYWALLSESHLEMVGSRTRCCCQRIIETVSVRSHKVSPRRRTRDDQNASCIEKLMSTTQPFSLGS